MLRVQLLRRVVGQAALRSFESRAFIVQAPKLRGSLPLRLSQRFSLVQRTGFQQETVRMYQLSAAEKKQYQDAFKQFDKDGDGRVTMEELSAFLQEIDLYPGPQMVGEMMKAADKNNDGFVELEEFLKVVEERTFVAGTFRGIASSTDDSAHMIAPSAKEKELYSEAFKKFDADGDGRVTKDELESFLHSINLNPGPQTIDAMMKAADKNNSGSVSEEELLKVMQEDTFVAGVLRGAAHKA